MVNISSPNLGDLVTTVRSSTVETNEWNGICYGNGLFVAVSRRPLLTNNQIMTSPDGITWTTRSSPNINAWYDVCYGNGTFVAVAESLDLPNNSVIISNNGIDWTSVAASPNNGSWTSVCFGNGLFVAVGDGGQGIMYSKDLGRTWINNPLNDTIGIHWRHVCFSNEISTFVAVENTVIGRAMYSYDGINWAAAKTVVTAGRWLKVNYVNGMFLATSHDGSAYMMKSVDGISWTEVTLPSGNVNRWSVVSYSKYYGLYITVSAGSTSDTIYKPIMTSRDGITWTSLTPDGTSNISWSSICYGKGRYVAVANVGTNRVMTITSNSFFSKTNTNLLELYNEQYPNISSISSIDTYNVNIAGLQNIKISNLFTLYRYGTKQDSGYKINGVDIGNYLQPLSSPINYCNYLNIGWSDSPWFITNTKLSNSYWIWNTYGANISAPSNILIMFYYSFIYTGTSNTGTYYIIIDDTASFRFNNTLIATLIAGWPSAIGNNTGSISIVNGLNNIQINGYNYGGPAGLLAAFYDSNNVLIAKTNIWWNYSLGTLPFTFSTAVGSTKAGGDMMLYTITSSTVLTVNTTTSFNIIMVGGGGGGASNTPVYSSANGGGGGAIFLSKIPITFTPGSYTITIGQGGAGAAGYTSSFFESSDDYYATTVTYSLQISTTGSNGGSTSISGPNTTISVPGGSGGTGNLTYSNDSSKTTSSIGNNNIPNYGIDINGGTGGRLDYSNVIKPTFGNNGQHINIYNYFNKLYSCGGCAAGFTNNMGWGTAVDYTDKIWGGVGGYNDAPSTNVTNSAYVAPGASTYTIVDTDIYTPSINLSTSGLGGADGGADGGGGGGGYITCRSKEFIANRRAKYFINNGPGGKGGNGAVYLWCPIPTL
jgi:hypothetical protein